VDADHCGGVWGGPKVTRAFGFCEQRCLPWSDGEENQQGCEDGQQSDDEYEHDDQSVLAARVAAYPHVTGSSGVVDAQLVSVRLGQEFLPDLPCSTAKASDLKETEL